MPRMSGEVSVGANAVTTNQLAGLLEEFARMRTRLRVGAVAAVAGANGTLLLNDMDVLNDQMISKAARFPIIPDDLIIDHVIPKGARSVVLFRNTTGVAIVVDWLVDIKQF